MQKYCIHAGVKEINCQNRHFRSLKAIKNGSFEPFDRLDTQNLDLRISRLRVRVSPGAPPVPVIETGTPYIWGLVPNSAIISSVHGAVWCRSVQFNRTTIHSLVVAITGGKLDFSPWEQLFYGESDGRRRKRMLIKIIGE